MPKEIYLDNAAATPPDPAVIHATSRAMAEAGNPSSFNDAGRRASLMLAGARNIVARFLNARPDEVVFCASGSEANTLALIGVGHACDEERSHIVSAATEHLSVLQSVRRLERRGWAASWVPVDGVGRVSSEDVARALTPKTRLVSLMYANNEVGTIQPIKRIAAIIRAWRKKRATNWPYLHVDACQATSWLPMDVQALGADLVTFNGTKAHGPRGSAVLFVRRGVELKPQVMGGTQEEGRRAGTEDVPGAVGLAKALGHIKKSDAVRVAKLRDYFLSTLPTVLPDARLNGPEGNERLANNINISVPGADSENLLLELDRHGIRAGSGSACTAHSVEPSHVLKAIGTPRKYLPGALRFSLSKHTTRKDIDALIRALPLVVARVRRRRI